MCLKPVGSAMKKIFGFGSKKGESPFGSFTSSRRESGNRINSRPEYHIRDKDLGKIDPFTLCLFSFSQAAQF